MNHDPKAVAARAEMIYEQDLKAELEKTHPNYFLAIEPDSHGRTLTDAIGAARAAHPDRLCHVVRVGHPTAVHIGVYQS